MVTRTRSMLRYMYIAFLVSMYITCIFIVYCVLFIPTNVQYNIQ